jgi:transcriptional activator HAC1
MEAIFNPLGFATPEYYPPQATVSLAETTFMPSPESSVQGDDDKKSHQPPTKKRKSWGQELPIPKTSLPPRYVD